MTAITEINVTSGAWSSVPWTAGTLVLQSVRGDTRVYVGASSSPAADSPALLLNQGKSLDLTGLLSVGSVVRIKSIGASGVVRVMA